tara:strand:+ start:5604 stop:6425 length:822 start_codon:yes stop_codon:yes gene_type:complete
MSYFMTKERTTDKFHALQLFTDTFSAETVHLTNKAVGIYIRLLCFAWTKNTKPFTSESAYRICQCIDDICRKQVDYILQEFFKCEDEKDAWTHKRLIREYDYLKNKYLKKSISGSIGAEIRWNKSANGKSMAPSPIPSPTPSSNNKGYDPSFERLWSYLNIKKGSKFKAHQTYQKTWQFFNMDLEDIGDIYNKQIEGVENTFIPHFSTWLNQRRWEIKESDQKKPDMPNLREKMEKLGYIYRHSEDHFDYFKKDGKEFKIDRYDKEHIIQNVE